MFIKEHGLLVCFPTYPTYLPNWVKGKTGRIKQALYNTYYEYYVEVQGKVIHCNLGDFDFMTFPED